MKLKVSQFCTLSTSPSWQSWLFSIDQSIYKSFKAKMQNSRGCTQNREIMLDTLAALQDSGHIDTFSEFILTNYPYIIEGHEAKMPKYNGPVFEYNPDIITFPRRMVFTGESNEVKRKLNSFLLDKYRHDSIIVDNIAYIEYLTREDKDIEDKIPAKNWLIAAYRIKAVGR